MSCPKNIVKSKFLGLFPQTFWGPHDFEYTVEQWAFKKWAVDRRCKACGCSDHDFGISHQDMLYRGFTPEFRSTKYDKCL